MTEEKHIETKSEKREKVREKLSKKNIKHWYWKRWEDILMLQLKNSSKAMKKEMIDNHLNVVIKGKNKKNRLF